MLIITLHLLNQKESYIDYNYKLLTIPSSAYNNLNINPNKYFYEFKDKFFINILNKNKSTQQINKNNFKNINLSIKQRYELEKIIKKYIENIFNKELEQYDDNLFYVYRFIINETKVFNDIYLVNTSLILYRNNKIYGVSIKLDTLHKINSEELKLYDFDLMGFIFEDKMFSEFTLPNNVYTNIYQDANDNKTIIKTPEYEKKNICKYLEDLKKFRNIEADNYKKLCLD